MEMVAIAIIVTVAREKVLAIVAQYMAHLANVCTLRVPGVGILTINARIKIPFI
jgi:hypothetical protein